MKKVIAYIRVSTDEQADKGYSQRHQDEMLARYCSINNFTAVQTYYEDHSAKNFERPEFNKLLITLLKSKVKLCDAIIFTKWDRFSRNAGDAYQMIAKLRKIGIEVNAVEQPLDLSVPENKMMLAFYLAAPEVENDRRAMNVSNGMLRARKEGRYMGKAPIGYSNVIIGDRKAIAPSDKAAMIRSIFLAISEEYYSAEGIWKQWLSKGLTCSKNNFWNIIRNHLYCGYVNVPAHMDKPAYLQKGTHEAIISPSLFYKVQDILHGRKKSQKARIKIDDHFPMRGFLCCTRCKKTLTASTTVKKKKNRYSYYHCTSKCGERYRIEIAHEAFKKELSRLQPLPAVKVLLQAVIHEHEQQQRKHERVQIDRIKTDLTVQITRKEKALSLLLENNIAPDDYYLIKQQCEQKTFKMEEELASLSVHIQASTFLQPCLNVLEELPGLYEKANAEHKRQILGSILEQKLEFNGITYRALPLNEAMRFIYTVGNALSKKEMGQTADDCNLSHQVNLMAPFSNQFVSQLKKIAALAA
jgi:site-specific DNA recombinase